MMAHGKYYDYYWSVKKTDKGYVWQIKSDWKKDAEVIEASVGNGFYQEYYETQEEATIDAIEAIQYHYI